DYSDEVRCRFEQTQATGQGHGRIHGANLGVSAAAWTRARYSPSLAEAGGAVQRQVKSKRSTNNILHNIHYAKSAIRAASARLRWVWLWIKTCLPNRSPSETEIAA
ncbi:hypothetical protein QYF21_22510, partial [Xanthomonas citri pv. viticola]